MNFWRDNVDKMLEFNDKEVLKTKGSITKVQMEIQVTAVYQDFDQTRKAIEAEQTDLKELEEVNALLKTVGHE